MNERRLWIVSISFWCVFFIMTGDWGQLEIIKNMGAIKNEARQISATDNNNYDLEMFWY